MKRALLVCYVGVLGPLSASSAQDASSELHTSLGIMVGRDNMTGAYSDGFKGGVAVGGVAQFPTSSRRLSVRADVMLHIIGEKDEVCDERGCADQGLSATLGSATLSLVARLNDPLVRWSPYVLVGPAAYLRDAAFESVRANHFGVQGGVGFEVRSTQHTFFVEARYLGMPPGGVVPVILGLRFY
ncbi:MAG TPA: outer membrane beta-barrel protein [Gemmatimonadaceae bacterium]|nr:outer membrane beta-barrel protein [Gemmatimonadaceae bacterium]